MVMIGRHGRLEVQWSGWEVALQSWCTAETACRQYWSAQGRSKVKDGRQGCRGVQVADDGFSPDIVGPF